MCASMGTLPEDRPRTHKGGTGVDGCDYMTEWRQLCVVTIVVHNRHTALTREDVQKCRFCRKLVSVSHS